MAFRAHENALEIFRNTIRLYFFFVFRYFLCVCLLVLHEVLVFFFFFFSRFCDLRRGLTSFFSKKEKSKRLHGIRAFVMQRQESKESSGVVFRLFGIRFSWQCDRDLLIFSCLWFGFESCRVDWIFSGHVFGTETWRWQRNSSVSMSLCLSGSIHRRSPEFDIAISNRTYYVYVQFALAVFRTVSLFVPLHLFFWFTIYFYCCILFSSYLMSSGMLDVYMFSPYLNRLVLFYFIFVLGTDHLSMSRLGVFISSDFFFSCVDWKISCLNEVSLMFSCLWCRTCFHGW